MSKTLANSEWGCAHSESTGSGSEVSLQSLFVLGSSDSLNVLFTNYSWYATYSHSWAGMVLIITMHSLWGYPWVGPASTKHCS